MNVDAPDGPDPKRPLRQDGGQSRQRLLLAALTLFAQQGFAKTSTREIAEAAQTNIAAISYYFGDKAGLYRAAFFEPLTPPHEAMAQFNLPALSLPEALRCMYGAFLEPLRQGHIARLCMKLRMREMIEPTGLWQHELSQGIRPMHDAFVRVLCRHLGLTDADDSVLRLAVCLTGLGVHLHLSADVIDVLAPGLQAGERSTDQWLAHLLMYAEAMVAAEQQRRAAVAMPFAATAISPAIPASHAVSSDLTAAAAAAATAVTQAAAAHSLCTAPPTRLTGVTRRPLSKPALP